MKDAYIRMIKQFPGGWEGMAGALKMPSKAALENRVYERQGQSVLVKTALEMQALSRTTAFAEAVAKEAHGVFLRLPEINNVVGREDLLQKFNTLYAELGRLSSTFRDATLDDEVDAKERANLANVGQVIHRTVEELLRLTFLIYCRSSDERPTVG